MDVSRLQGDQLTATQGVLYKIKGHNYTLAVTGATTSALGDQAANKRVASVAGRFDDGSPAARCHLWDAPQESTRTQEGIAPNGSGGVMSARCGILWDAAGRNVGLARFRRLLTTPICNGGNPCELDEVRAMFKL